MFRFCYGKCGKDIGETMNVYTITKSNFIVNIGRNMLGLKHPTEKCLPNEDIITRLLSNETKGKFV